MPLLFNSLSHGDVAFGFFNIETDLLLLNNYFFFASDFCTDVAAIAAADPDKVYEGTWRVYILDEDEVGNLMGAIHGVDFHGFIGDVYRLFPFPKEEDAFKQNPDGHMRRQLVEAVIRKYADPQSVAVRVDDGGAVIDVGEYLFSREGFHDLLRYVWVGGYPRWREGKRPDYVEDMAALLFARHPLFEGLSLT